MKKIRYLVIWLILISLAVSCKVVENNSKSSSDTGISSTISNTLVLISDSGLSGKSSLSDTSASSDAADSSETSILASSSPASKTSSKPVSKIISALQSSLSSSQTATPTPTPPIPKFTNFITRSGDKLMDGTKEFRFIGINTQIFDPMWMKSYPTWNYKWEAPDDYELEDIIRTVDQIGGKVIRFYAFSTGGDRVGYEPYVIAPGQFSQAGFSRLDKLFVLCNKYKVRLILGFVDYFDTMGGVSNYAGWRGKSKDEFFTDPQIIADFKLTIDFATNRYKNEKALLCWETGNEMPVNANVDAWARDITAYIKSKDPNHLVEDGRLSMGSGISDDSLTNPNVDIVSSHYYHWVQGTEYAKYCNEDKIKSAGKKVFIVEEYGYANANVGIYHDLIDAAISNGTSGAMIWAMVNHSKNGGFYWHDGYHEAMGTFWTYHWPGFVSGDSYNEIQTMNLIREHAYEIQGKSLPDMPIPDSPFLLPIYNVNNINWRGSAGATLYDVERSISRSGPWLTVGTDISDGIFGYKALFEDTSAESGISYYYRVKAKNITGISLPSNIAGPVKAA